MKMQQLQYTDKAWKIYMHAEEFDRMQCQLVLAFGPSGVITDTAVFNYLERSYPEAHIILTAAAGEVILPQLFLNSVVVNAFQFDNTIVHCAETNISKHANSYEAGHCLMQQLQQSDLYTAFLMADNTVVNGCELLAGFNKLNSQAILVSGGLTGNRCQFSKAFVGLNQAPGDGVIIAIGFYGRQLQLNQDSFGAWNEYGPVQTITAFKEI
ncbi:hypothetical protein A4H97_04065 [Niastella yeongjuensis]|uniref:FIST domain-containing protein n=1 Tax=Niastella yeongjuensis TaxID=354355 RepID=A0A1V9EYI2_9BACT|nr:FIST N-terminal domain-containing protein [Niastella yeongjuensis]OQP51004.1 hypothetical protein A4H97_04065 [Niastella yeongjuensis]SEN07426.1 FIST N domain-containing protein [Niastella yeongjuensis]